MTHLNGITADSKSTGWVNIASWLPAGLSIPTSGWARAIRTGSLVTVEMQVDVDDQTLTSLLNVPTGWRKTNAALSRVVSTVATAPTKGVGFPNPTHGVTVYLGASGVSLRCSALTNIGTIGVTAMWYATDASPA